MRLVLDNTVMSNFALVGRTHWLREIWPGMLATFEEALEDVIEQRGMSWGDRRLASGCAMWYTGFLKVKKLLMEVSDVN